MPLYKKLDCDAKSEPHYFATTHNYAWENCVVGFLKTSNPLVEMPFSIHKHNELIILKNWCVLTLTPN
jgi:hypothetical protein